MIRASDISAKDDQEPHVADQMHPATVQEHGREQRQENRERSGGLWDRDGRVSVGDLPLIVIVIIMVRHFRTDDLRPGEVGERADFFGNQAKTEREIVAEKALGAENDNIDGNQTEGHPGNFATGLQLHRQQ